MRSLIGKKIGMSQMFLEDGTVIPITVIEVGNNIVVQVKTKDKDGYDAVQVGAGSKKKISKALKGHLKNLGSFGVLKEFKPDQEMKSGETLNASVFSEGDTVKISGVSKGKGFQGGVKRHGFAGMPASHGHHSVMRHGGSIGQRFPQHTLKGMRMPGRMGGAKSSVRGLKVVKVDAEKGLIAVRGAVPGNPGSYVQISSQ